MELFNMLVKLDKLLANTDKLNIKVNNIPVTLWNNTHNYKIELWFSNRLIPYSFIVPDLISIYTNGLKLVIEIYKDKYPYSKSKILEAVRTALLSINDYLADITHR